MKTETRLLGPHALMKFATRAATLARQAWEEPRAYRLAGRATRDPHDAEVFCDAFVKGVKSGDETYLDITKELRGWLALQFAMEQASRAMWEQLWNDAHPDRFGRAWDEEDFELMSVWREQVRAMIKECHEEAIFAITVEEYFAQLTEAGASEEDAEALAEWISEVHEGDPPSTEVA